MEFVGRKVRKEFKGYGVFTGVVKSYDSSSGFFEIGYDDGDSEEIDFSELAALVDVDGVHPDYSPSLLVKKTSKVGRRPKKRRRVLSSSNSGNENDFSSSVGNAVTADGSNLEFVDAELRKEGITVDNLTKKLEFSSNNNNNVSISCSNLNSTNGKGNGDENDSNEKSDLGDYPVKKECCFDLNMDLDNDENKNEDVDLGGYMIKGNSVGKVEENQGTLVDQTDNVVPVLDHDGSLQKTCTSGRRGLKKRKITNSPVNAESVLRRSARRRAKSSTEDHDLNAIKYDDNDDISAFPSGQSPVISAVSMDQPTISGCEESEAPSILPPKLKFPQSAGNVNLDGLPVLDLFSVYAFLRSFSTILFLSPFELGDFVASLRSKSPSLLIDSIHVSLLRTLRKHLEFQSIEGSTSASNCLRDLNWDLLDLITWPSFMAEYLLMKPGFDLAQLKLFKTDYHKQPEFVKLKLLQYICDDVIEAEVISSELNKRIIGEPNIVVDPDLNTKFSASKKRRATTMAVSGSSYISEEVIDETADWNSDECCLCKMDGNLICCDGCPAAFHSKCVGIASNLLPEGDWFCPECVVDKKNPEINMVKSIRGAELLGVDPDGRLYYSSCGYLLVSDVCDAEPLFHYYHMNDLTALIDALNILNGPYKAISNAITKHWSLYNKLCGEKSNLDSENASEAKSELERQLAHSAGSSDISEAVASIQNSSKTGVDLSNNGNELSQTTTRKGISKQLEVGYLNLYSFARVASSVAREWIRKPSEKTPQIHTKSLEELISIQMKAISKTSVDFCWANIKNLTVDAQKEKCGWCLACKFPTDDGNCLFLMNNITDLENFNYESLGFGSRISKKDHLIDVMCHILYIEERLHGLLLGPWLNPHFPKIYRKSFLEASDIVPLKELLLTLESNIWLRALSDDWSKHVDSVVTVGSATHIVTSKLRMPSRNVVGKKRSKSTDPEPHSSKNASSGLGLFWWRGGRLTRKLFNWKALPRSLACKAARQGGGKKIDGILYPDNSDFPKRSKAVVWRASVESAVTVEQLALQVRELDATIKWEEIENSSHLAKMDKESIKSMRSFKKAIIRRKSSEGAVVKYLLDFGKRRFIPDTVVKYGTKIEESSSDRKKYWVEEPYVPLFLLKPFEDRRIALKSNKMTLNSLLVSRKMLKKSKKVDFEYLFANAEKSENHQCGHCNKDVLVRDAISCRSCEGFFHKRHIRKTSGGTYTCHKCHFGQNTLKPSPKKGKSHSRKTKKVSQIVKKGGKRKQLVQAETMSKSFVVPLRRSARTAKIVSLQGKKKLVKKKKKKQPKSGGKKQLKSGDKKKPLNFVSELVKPKGKRGRPRKIKETFQKKRSHMYFATYWLNGFLLSRKPDDNRVTDFQTKNHLVPFQPLDSIIDQPRCSLCHEPEFRSSLNYITCGTCADWYHLDAFGLREEHMGVVIDFKCHKCRERVPPICPYLHPIGNETKSGEAENEELSEVLLKQKTDTIEEPNAAETVPDCKQDLADAQIEPESTRKSTHDAMDKEESSEVSLKQKTDNFAETVPDCEPDLVADAQIKPESTRDDMDNEGSSEVLLKQKIDSIEEPNSAETVPDCKRDHVADAQIEPMLTRDSTHDAMDLEKEPCVAVEQNGSLKANESNTTVDVVQRVANEDGGEAVDKQV